MEQEKYNEIMQLKRMGRFEECEKIYLNYLSSGQEIDGTFCDGYSKILILKRNYFEAKVFLIHEFLLVFKRKLKVLEKLDNEEPITLSDRVLLAYIDKGLKIYDAINSIAPRPFNQLANNYNVQKIDVVLSLTEDLHDLLFKYIFCKSCLGELNDEFSAPFNNLCQKYRNSIERVYQGTNDKVDRENFDLVFNAFLEPINEWVAKILLLLPEIFKAIKK